jgi:centrosomal protein CEP76
MLSGFHSYCLTAELQIPVGLLSLDLEVVPLKMPPNPKELPIFVELASISKQLARDAELTAGVEARFHAYAKAWWNDYNCTRPLHQTRLIQIFGLDESRSQKCVCTFLSPVRADRCLDSPLHAARFVRLLPYAKDVRVGGQRTEIWHSAHTILARRSGDLEDHALLLCSLLLGFGLDAFVAIGTTHEKGAHIWVLTRGSGNNVTMWESLTGQRFELDADARANAAQASAGSLAARSGVSPSFPFARIHCLFNHRSFYANNQLEDEVALVDFNLENPASWKAMNERAIEVLQRKAPVFLRAPALLPLAEERALERKIKELAMNYRREYANVS